MADFVPKNEFDYVSKLEPSPGGDYFFIPLDWLRKWRNFTLGNSENPGKISFKDFIDKKGNLKQSLQIKKDYQVISSEQWSFFKAKYSSDNEFSSKFKNIYNKPEVPLIEFLKNTDPPSKPPLRPNSFTRPNPAEKTETFSKRAESKERIRESKVSTPQNLSKRNDSKERSDSSISTGENLYKTSQNDFLRLKNITQSQNIQARPIRSSTPLQIKKPRQEISNPGKKDKTLLTEGASRLSLLSRNLSKPVLKFGIFNPRFQCFMNTVLQCLFSFESFTNRLEKDPSGPVSRALNSAIKEARSSRGQDTVITCQTLPAIFTKTFPGYKQHDAPEFCRALLDKLNEEYPKNKPKGELSPWNTCRSQFSSIISEEFLGMLCSTVLCLSCRNESFSYEPFTMLMLELTRRLETSISEFLNEEVISNYKCEKCKKNTRIKKFFQFHQLPKGLVIQLKRFRFSNSPFKLDNKCEFGLTLDVIDQEGDVLRYQLVAVGVHLGNVLGGHYFAYCVRDKWYRFDDETVTEVDLGKVLSSQAYLLCYKLIE
jgi:ubiquitin C-terminal hydrolase